MEVFFIIVLILIIVVVLVRNSGKKEEGVFAMNVMDSLFKEIGNLKKEVQELRAEVAAGNKEIIEQISELPLVQSSTDAPLRQFVVQPEPLQQSVAPVAPIVELEPEIVIQQVVAATIEPQAVEEEYIIESSEPIAEAIEEVAASEVVAGEEHEFARPLQQPQPAYPEDTESGMDKWLRNNPDLEKFIGENLINKIGIAILVLGIAFFVKYAIDKEWINEVGRVSIGIGCGALLVGIAHFLRNSYRSFSSVLAGGGIAVFYFTIAFAFHQYHLMPQAAAFVVMVVITGFAIALSVLYDKIELGIIATVGGFITPFLLSTGDGNYIVLFTYLIILDIGVLLLAYFKRWKALNIIALGFTEIIFGGWLGTKFFTTPTVSYPLTMAFASAFYFIFLGMNMVHQMKNKLSFVGFDFAILLFVSSTYYAAGMSVLHVWDGGAYQGVFTLLLGMVNLGLAYYVYKSGKADRNLLFLLIGMTLTFITLTIPIQLHGHAITLFWSAEFVLLYWLSDYSGIKIFKYSSFLICMLAFISLTMDWENASKLSGGGLHLIFNDLRGIITNVVAIGSFTAWYFVIRRGPNEEVLGFSTKYLGRIAINTAVVLLYLTCIFGVNLYFHKLTNYAIPNVYYRLITEVFAILFLFLIQGRKYSISPWLQIVTLAGCFLMLIISYSNIVDLRSLILGNNASVLFFYIHWLDCLLFGVITYLTIKGVRTEPDVFSESIQLIAAAITFIIITFLSMELLHVYVMAAHNNNNTSLLISQYNKAGLTVIWALCSFILMWLGMTHRQKMLRIISLILFSIVLLKLFIFDISGISEGGKILAFILLGVLLLTVSFMYQKLKKIIIDDKKE